MKYLQLNDKQIESNLKKMLKNLRGNKNATLQMSDAFKVPFAKAKDIGKPKIVLTQEAYQKMKELVNKCDIEIAWHNTVERSGNTFTVLDTYIYPQFATGATVEADEDKYNAWFDQLEDDEYNAMRMQGHSHVNMGCGPSSTDEAYYDLMTKHLKSWYVFLIMNKRGQFYARIYDIQNNIIFEHTDIVIIMPPNMYEDWACEAIDEYVTKRGGSSVDDMIGLSRDSFLHPQESDY